MIHLDSKDNFRSYFRPQLLGVVNKVFKRNYEAQSTVDTFFNIRVTPINTWSFSFVSVIISWALMLCVGFLGLIFPPSVVALMAILPILDVERCLFSNVFAHGMLLALVVSLMTTNVLVLTALGLFFVLRLIIDIPQIAQLFSWNKLHDTIGSLYINGYVYPMEASENLKSCIKVLVNREIPNEYIVEAYTYGHELARNTKYSKKEISDFIVKIIEEYLYDANVG